MSGASRRRPGTSVRARKSAEDLRSHRIRVRLTDEEFAEVKKKAEGRPLSQYAREVMERAVKEPPPRIPTLSRETMREITKQGNRLNQLVRLAHTGRVSDQLEPLLWQLYETLVNAYRELKEQSAQTGRKVRRRVL